ncbi:MAG: PH domain-containing protein [Bdellovibrionota bacterium]
MSNIISSVDDYSEIETQIDLKARYPRPLRSIVRRCLIVVLAALVILMITTISSAKLEQGVLDEGFVTAYQNLLFWIQTLCFVIIGGKIIYEILYFNLYYYRIEEGHLVISTGVFLKDRASFPLDTINDVFLRRTVLDFVFGLYDVIFSTASQSSSKLAKIRDVSTPVAAHIQDYMNLLIAKTHPDIQKAKAAIRQEQIESENKS